MGDESDGAIDVVDSAVTLKVEAPTDVTIVPPEVVGEKTTVGVLTAVPLVNVGDESTGTGREGALTVVFTTLAPVEEPVAVALALADVAPGVKTV
jgi:hypothetical protein